MISIRLRNFAITAIILIACMGGISLVQDEMIETRTEHKLVEADELRNAPPAVAFTSLALGGFRGILADILFLRSQAMHESGNYFELVQLADWLTKLQPRFTGATAYLAWNMSYNVSVTFNAPEDRWRWVQRGIELIRDQGLDYNPGDPVLYQELGWIYQHKVGHILDDANMYYKTQLAAQMIEAAGDRGPIDWAGLANAPNDLTELQATLGDERYAQLTAILAAHTYTPQQLESDFRKPNPHTGFPEAIEAELREAELFSIYNAYLRSRWFRERYKLDPEFIVEIRLKHGDLDFRLPEAHAIYWASKGLEASPNGTNVKCDRMINQSLMNAMRYGRVKYLSENGIPFVGPNLDIIDNAQRAYKHAMAVHPGNRSFKSGWENFVKDAIVITYAEGDRERADGYLKELRAEFPRKLDYKKNIDWFAMNELNQDVADKSLKQLLPVVNGYIYQAYLAAAMGDLPKAQVTMQRAEAIRTSYMKEKDTERQEKRTGMADFQEMQVGVLNAILDPDTRGGEFAAFPELVVNLRANLNLPAGATVVTLKGLDTNMLQNKDIKELEIQRN